MKVDDRLGIGVLLAAMVATSVAWYSLARACGTAHVIAAVPSIALDIGGLFYSRNWIFGTSVALRRWGRFTTLAAVLISLGGGGIHNALVLKLITVEQLPWLAFAVGAIPGTAAFAVGHQLALRSAVQRQEQQEQQERVGQVDPADVVEIDTADLADARTDEASSAQTVGPEPDPDSASATSEPRPHGTVVELARRPNGQTKVARARALYRRLAQEIRDRGGSLDEIVLADIDRHIDSSGYAKKHAAAWRAEVEAEWAARQEG